MTESNLIAFLFPGQGSQAVGQLADFAAATEVRNRVLQEPPSIIHA